MADKVSINPRYLGYNTPEVRQLLQKVEGITVAEEANVRALVTDYTPEEEPSEGSE